MIISFNDVKIGGRFFYDDWEYIKICCPQSGKIGAVDLHSGTHTTDCSKWMVEVPIEPTKEKKTEQGNEIVIFTYEFDDPTTDPTIMRITKEQKRIIEILYDYDILCPDINVSFKSDTFIVDATKE